MKKFFCLTLCFVFGCYLKAQTADEILLKHQFACGSIAKIAAIQTLQYETNIKMNMMNRPFELSVKNYAVQGKLKRTETSGMMGMKGSYTLITDTAVYTSTPTIPAFGDFGGMEGGIKKMDATVLAASIGKLNIGIELFPLVFAKQLGNTVELAGSTTIDSTECYKLKTTSSEKEETTYYVNAKTYLIKQIEMSSKQMAKFFGMDQGPMGGMMGRRGAKQKVEINITAYKQINGIRFPLKQTVKFGAADVEIENNGLLVNEPISPRLYMPN